MILQIDRGNTRLKWRLREDRRDVAHGAIPNDEVYSSLSSILAGQSIQHIFIVSVLGEAQDRAFADWAVKEFGVMPRFARAESKCAGVTNGYAFPERLGVDRWLAMIAGYTRVNRSCVVVDCGSAITVDLLDQQGVHHGGYIAPGIVAMQRALSINTQGVKVQGGVISTDLAPGRDTVSAVSAAQLAMMVGLVQQAIKQLSLIESSAFPPALLFTGGDGPLLAKFFNTAVLVPDLVLDGLELIFSVD